MDLRRRPKVLSACALAAVIALAACSPNPDASSDSSDASGGTTQAAAGPVSVVLADFTFSPTEIAVAAGTASTLEITNEGASVHSLIVDAGGTEIASDDIDPGASTTLELPPLEEGTYDVWCGVPGHKETGMVGTLVVDGSGSSSESGGTMASDGMAHDATSVAAMLEGHQQGVEDFVANITEPITEGIGAQPLRPTLEGTTKVFDITVENATWEVSPGVTKEVSAYNGTVPGPEIRVHQGDHIKVVVHNEIEEPTTVHFHGVRVPNAMDGVPFVTQDPILSGETFEYEFTVHDKPGTYMYHSHFDSAAQIDHGLYAPFIVEPTGKPDYDVEATMVLGDGYLGYNLNGKGFPATSAIAAKKGQTVLIHLANMGEIIHPMHLHGYDFLVLQQDGEPLPQPYEANTLMVAPGNTYDVLVEADKPGVWAYHCHILNHVEGADGMFGMVTALVVT